jgi:hypothetical protein
MRLVELGKRGGGSECVTQPPVAEEVALAVVQQYGPSVRQYVELLRCTNGLDCFGLHFCDVREMFQYDDLVAVQNWGNGDLDCIDSDGKVVFTNHQPDARVVIANDVGDWLGLVALEAESRSTIRHPRDYLGAAEPGVYSGVLDALKGYQCELNRWRNRVSK